MESTLIIAEVGVNHNGDYETAVRLIEASKSAGADIVKFQSAVPNLVSTGYAKKANYQSVNCQADTSQLQMIKDLHLPLDAYKSLKEQAKRIGIDFMSTAFDLVSLDFLIELGMPYLKIPSGEITNLPYLQRAGKCDLDIILSTGMSTLGEVEDAIDVLINAGKKRRDITLLHCTTEYPAPLSEVNLRAMQTLGTAFDVSYGYSDHTKGAAVAVAAIGLGASVIEKHITLDNNMPGPDHRASLEPNEFRKMVEMIRDVEISLGSRIKHVGVSERQNIEAARKSLVASTSIKRGEVFTAENLTCKRPGTGISPMRLGQIIGKRARHDYNQDELIEE